MKRTPEDIQDELLVLQCQNGDPRALTALVRRWRPRLLRLAWRLTAERELAQDVTQDSLLAIVRGLSRMDDPAAFRVWAYRIVRHKCLDGMRRRSTRRRAVARAADAGDSTGDGAPQPDQETDRLAAALRRLSDEQRAVLSLHYLDGVSVREIAAILELPAGTVKSRLFHARDRLRDVLERKTS